MQALVIMLLLAQAPGLERYVAAQNAYAANPRSEARLVALVTILFESDRNDLGIALLEPFVKSNPSASRAKLFLALGYARQEKYAQSKSLAATVAAGLPTDYYAQHILGLSLFGLNEFTPAEAAFKRAVSLKPDFADSFFQLGLLYSRNPSTLQQAQAAYARALTIGFSNAEIYRNLGSLNIKLGEYDNAVTYLNKALELNPNYADAYFQLGEALRRSGKAEQAAEAIRKFQALNASALDAKERQNKGQALYEQGSRLIQNDELAKAYEVFRAASETFPQLDAAYYRMAQLEYLQDDRKRALANIQRAVELNPFEPEYYFVLARCLEHTDVRGSIEAVTQAISLRNNVADFHNFLGGQYEKSGDSARAVQSYGRAVTLEPKNQTFRTNLNAAQRRLPLKKP